MSEPQVDPKANKAPGRAAKNEEWGDEVKDVKASTLGEGESVDGRYLGYEWVMTKDQRSGESVPKRQHHVELTNPTDDNRIRKIWSAAMLDRKLAQVELGARVLIERGEDEIQLDNRGKKTGTMGIYSVRPALGKVNREGVLGRPEE